MITGLEFFIERKQNMHFFSKTECVNSQLIHTIAHFALLMGKQPTRFLLFQLFLSPIKTNRTPIALSIQLHVIRTLTCARTGYS